MDWVPNDGTGMIPGCHATKVPLLGSAAPPVSRWAWRPTSRLTTSPEVVRRLPGALIETATSPIDELMTHVTGPDFPTGGIINGRSGIIAGAYRTGRGSIWRGPKAEVEDGQKTGRRPSSFTRSYQVNKARLIREDRRAGQREENPRASAPCAMKSDKDGMRIVIEIKRGESGEIVLNNLYKHTADADHVPASTWWRWTTTSPR